MRDYVTGSLACIVSIRRYFATSRRSTGRIRCSTGDLTDESNDPTYRAIYHSIYQPIAGEANEVTPIDGRAMSYCGVPLWDRGDRIVATLCHFDQRARLYYPEDMRVLKAVAPLIATWVSARHLPSTRLRIV